MPLQTVVLCLLATGHMGKSLFTESTADVDLYGRVMFAQLGLLRIVNAEGDSKLVLDVIVGFDNQVPEDISAPDKAKYQRYEHLK